MSKIENLNLNDEQERWLKLLCRSESELEEFENKFLNQKKITMSLMNYRKYLMSKGRGQNIN